MSALYGDGVVFDPPQPCSMCPKRGKSVKELKAMIEKMQQPTWITMCHVTNHRTRCYGVTKESMKELKYEG